MVLALTIVSCDTTEPAITESDPVLEQESPAAIRWQEIRPWISMSPRPVLPRFLTDDRAAGWPVAGSPVTWTAHVYNPAARGTQELQYEWTVGGAVVSLGSFDFGPGINTVTYTAPFEEESREITFRVFQHRALDAHAASTTINSRALTVGFWVDRSIYDHVAQMEGVGSFHAWAQETVEQWSDNLARHGVRDRLRLDRIEVLPDGARVPAHFDTDLKWWFTDRVRDTRFLRSDSDLTVAKDQTIVLHELLHQRGLIDLYAFDIRDGPPGTSSINILNPDSTRAAGSPAMPFVVSNLVYSFPVGGLMSRALHRGAFVTRHSVFGLNLYAGTRTSRWVDSHGNPINGLMDANPYTLMVPESITIIPKAADGRSLAGYSLDVFFDKGFGPYEDIYESHPDLSVVLDPDGRAVLDDGPWRQETWLKRRDPNVLILRVRSDHDQEWSYGFLPAYELNEAYIHGERTHATLSVSLTPF